MHVYSCKLSFCPSAFPGHDFFLGTLGHSSHGMFVRFVGWQATSHSAFLCPRCQSLERFGQWAPQNIHTWEMRREEEAEKNGEHTICKRCDQKVQDWHDKLWAEARKAMNFHQSNKKNSMKQKTDYERVHRHMKKKKTGEKAQWSDKWEVRAGNIWEISNLNKCFQQSVLSIN